MLPYFLQDKIEDYIRMDEESRRYLTTKTVKRAFNNLNPYSFDYEEVRIQCLRLRLLFYVKEEKLRKLPEIDVVTVIEDICNNLHKEISRKRILTVEDFYPGRNDINDPGMDINNEVNDESDEKLVIEAVCKRFTENFRSKLSELLYFIVKTSYQCPDCDHIVKYATTVHCAYCLRPERAAIRLEKKNVTVKDLFIHSGLKRIYDDMNLFCQICNKEQASVKVSKKFYTLPVNLVLALEYSSDKNFIFQLEEFIDINDFVERKDINKSKYRLIGVICTEIGDDLTKYVSFTKDIIDGQWKYFNGKSYESSTFIEMQNHKNIQALLYTNM